MSTQTEPLTEAGRELLAAIKRHDFFEAERAILAIEAQATAAARAEVARQVRSVWIAGGWDAVLALLGEDAAPRQPEPETHDCEYKQALIRLNQEREGAPQYDAPEPPGYAETRAEADAERDDDVARRRVAYEAASPSEETR